jgi:glutathione S-transferase
MKLWYAPTSPFARKVRIAAHELGLSHRMGLLKVDPWSDARLRALNPLAKVPTLELSDGTAIFESALICEYLDAQMLDANAPRLFPAPGPARWHTLLRQGLADGAAAAAGRLYAEQRRSEADRVPGMEARFQAAIDAALDALEKDVPPFGEPLIGDIAAAAFIGYLDFRFPATGWRIGRLKLSAWFDVFCARPSMQATEHRPHA